MNTKDIQWKTKDGRLIVVKDMSNSHILNAHRYMQARLADCSGTLLRAWNFLAMLNGEMAQECMERNIDEMEDKQAEIRVWVWTFEDEIEKRGLTPLESNKCQILKT